jgi:nucleoside-diphosphate-sugar epimerase
MKSKSILFVGCGDVGARTGALLQAQGWQVAGMRRTPSRLPPGFKGIGGDYTQPGSLAFIADLRPDYVVTTFNPVDRTVEGYRQGFSEAAGNLLAGLGSYHPRAVFMVSSTRVFAEQGGGWVDESSELSATDPRAVAIIEAEQILLQSSQRGCVVRFAGIYGAPQGRLLQRLRRGEVCPAEPLRYTNRIHRDDCAGFLTHLVARMESGAELAPVYLGVDNLPAPQYEVESWLLGVLGVKALDPQGDPSAGRTPDGRTPDGHKRCSNRLLRASGYRLRYPDYRAGYRAVLA